MRVWNVIVGLVSAVTLLAVSSCALPEEKHAPSSRSTTTTSVDLSVTSDVYSSEAEASADASDKWNDVFDRTVDDYEDQGFAYIGGWVSREECWSESVEMQNDLEEFRCRLEGTVNFAENVSVGDQRLLLSTIELQALHGGKKYSDFTHSKIRELLRSNPVQDDNELPMPSGNVDLEKEINNRVKKRLPMNSNTVECYDAACNNRRWYSWQLRDVFVDAQIDQVEQLNAIPPNEKTRRRCFTNSSFLSDSVDTEIRIREKESKTFTSTKSFQKTTKVNGSLDLKLKGDAAEFGGGFSSSVDIVDLTKTEDKIVTEYEQTEDYRIKFTNPPKTMIVIEYNYRQIPTRYRYSGEVRFDGDFQTYWSVDTRPPATNIITNWAPISSIVPADEQKFRFEGITTDVNVSEIERSFRALDITEHPQPRCAEYMKYPEKKSGSLAAWSQLDFMIAD